MTRYGSEMANYEAVTIVMESRILIELPFRPSEDQLSTGKAWEDWIEGIAGYYISPLSYTVMSVTSRRWWLLLLYFY